MTTQVPDILIWQGEPLPLVSSPGLPEHHPRKPRGQLQYEDPLDAYLDLTGTTACWRRNIATWEVRGVQLYLTGLEGNRHLSDGPVLVDWVSGYLMAAHKTQSQCANSRFTPKQAPYLGLEVLGGTIVHHKLTGGTAS